MKALVIFNDLAQSQNLGVLIDDDQLETLGSQAMMSGALY